MGNVVRFYDPSKENGYLSNWYISPFTYAGKQYFSCEQYLMEQKALTFGDDEAAEKIMNSKNLSEIKRLGKQVARYNENLWKTIRPQVMRRGLRAKFQQNPQLLQELMNTGNAILAECAPRDAIWGIGIGMDDERSLDPKEWKGRNLLGRALMRVREDLRQWCAVAGEKVTEYVDAVDLKQPKPIRAKRRSGHTEDGEDISVWSMRIFEACMLPYVSEIVSTWLEEVFYDARRGHSYEDLSITNYSFEELEAMFRNQRINGIPIAGFFEMKQDIFDMGRYQGGLKIGTVEKPAALEKPEMPAEPVKPAETVKPAEPVRPAETVMPAEPVKPAEPVRPVEPVKPVIPAAPVKEAVPKPVQTVAQPASEPVETVKSAPVEQPVVKTQQEEVDEVNAIIAKAKADEAAAIARAEEARQAALLAKYRAEQMRAMAQAAFERAKQEAEQKSKVEAENRELLVAKAKEEAAKAREIAEAKAKEMDELNRRAAEPSSRVLISVGKVIDSKYESIVNVTTTTLSIGKGVDDEFFDVGGPELKRACISQKGCEIGKAVITVAGNLPAKNVIHTACPKYNGDGSDKKYLEKCYNSVLDLAMQKGIHEIAFPPIGSGYFGFPLRECAVVANQTVDRWMLKHADYSIKVNFVCPDQRTEAMFRGLRK